jgi:hypothetical protein
LDFALWTVYWHPKCLLLILLGYKCVGSDAGKAVVPSINDTVVFVECEDKNNENKNTLNIKTDVFACHCGMLHTFAK